MAPITGRDRPSPRRIMPARPSGELVAGPSLRGRPPPRAASLRGPGTGHPGQPSAGPVGVLSRAAATPTLRADTVRLADGSSSARPGGLIPPAAFFGRWYRFSTPSDAGRKPPVCLACRTSGGPRSRPRHESEAGAVGIGRGGEDAQQGFVLAQRAEHGVDGRVLSVPVTRRAAAAPPGRASPASPRHSRAASARYRRVPRARRRGNSARSARRCFTSGVSRASAFPSIAGRPFMRGEGGAAGELLHRAGTLLELRHQHAHAPGALRARTARRAGRGSPSPRAPGGRRRPGADRRR